MIHAPPNVGRQVGAGAEPAALAAVPAALEEIANFLFDPAASRLMRCRVAGEGERFAEVETLIKSWLAPQTLAKVNKGSTRTTRACPRNYYYKAAFHLFRRHIIHSWWALDNPDLTPRP